MLCENLNIGRHEDMARVKGSKQQRLIVVPHRPYVRFTRTVVALLLIGLSGAVGYWYGVSEGLLLRDKAESVLAEVTQQYQEKSERLDEASLLIATLERGSDVDRQATEGTRQLVVDLQDQVAALEEENALYRGIMSPALTVGGVTIQDFSITPTSNPLRTRFKLMLTQVGDNKNFIQGFAGVTIIGEQAGEKKALLLNDVSEQIENTDIRFRYRYFQDVTGEIVLPEGFTPEQIYVVAQTSGSGSARVERYFTWNTGDTNVGQ